MFPSAPSMPTNGSHILPSHASLASSMSTHCASLVPVRTRYTRGVAIFSFVACKPVHHARWRRRGGLPVLKECPAGHRP